MAEHWPNVAGKSLSKSIYKWGIFQQAMFDSRRVCRQDNVESHFFRQHLLFLLQHWTLHQFSTDFTNFIPFEPRTPKFPVPEMVETVRKSPKKHIFSGGKNMEKSPWNQSVLHGTFGRRCSHAATNFSCSIGLLGMASWANFWPANDRSKTGKTWWFYWHSNGGCANKNRGFTHLNDGLTNKEWWFNLIEMGRESASTVT